MNDIVLITIIVLLCLLFIYFVYALISTFLINKKFFLVRGKDPENPCYLQLSDYPELDREPIRIGYYGEKIQGYLYTQKEKKDEKGFIILSHGFFGTHIQYLADIYYLTSLGYTVLAYDQYGVGDSEGKNQVSLANGSYVLENVIRYVLKNNIHQGKDIILYGHSWGAYCSLCALGKYPQVKKAILRSGFVSPDQIVLSLLKGMKKGFYYSILPMYSICYVLLFGFRNTRHAKIGKNKNTEILVIHAMDDNVVSYKNSIAKMLERKKNKNIHIFITEKGEHNSLIAKEGLDNYKKSIDEYQKILSDYGEDSSQMNEFISSLDRRNMYPYNQEVVEEIEKFLKD